MRHLEVKDLLIQEKIRSHELKVSRVKPEDTRAELLTKFLDPERHQKLIKLLPPSVPGTRREVANSVVLVVVCSLSPVRATAGNQVETVEKIEEISVGAGWLATGSRTRIVESSEMTTWIPWSARWMLLVGVGCEWLCVTSKQTCPLRTGATQTEPFDIGDYYVFTVW